MLTVAVPKRNKLPNIIVLTPKDGMINEESQIKLQDTMQKIVNDSNGGLVCIII